MIKNIKKKKLKKLKKKKTILKDILLNYDKSKDLEGHILSFKKTYNQFLLTTIKNINIDGNKLGLLL